MVVGIVVLVIITIVLIVLIVSRLLRPRTNVAVARLAHAVLDVLADDSRALNCSEISERARRSSGMVVQALMFLYGEGFIASAQKVTQLAVTLDKCRFSITAVGRQHHEAHTASGQ